MIPESDYRPRLPKGRRPIMIIGAGGIVRDAHLPAYRKAGFDVVGLYNRTKSRAEALAADFDLPFVTDSLDEFIAAAPDNAVFDLALMPGQFEQVLSRLPEGSPVLIQKPMGDDFDQARRIHGLCEERSLVAAVNCQLRFAPYVAAARSLIEAGTLGTLYDFEVKVTVNTPWDLFPHVKDHPRLEIQQHSVHYVDLIRSFLGNPRSVYAKTVGHPEKTVSSSRSIIFMEYDDTTRAVISTNHDHEFGPDGEESYIKWEGSAGCVKAKMGLLMNYPDGVPDDFSYRLKSDREWTRQKLEGSWFPDAFIGTMSSLMRYAEGESDSLPTSVRDVLDSMAVVEAAYASSAAGGAKPPYASL